MGYSGFRWSLGVTELYQASCQTQGTELDHLFRKCVIIVLFYLDFGAIYFFLSLTKCGF